MKRSGSSGNLLHHDDGIDDLSRPSLLDFDDVSATSVNSRGSDSGLIKAARPAYIDPVVAEKEQKAVFWARVTVIVVLLIALAILATSMYLVVSRSEQENFESQFENHASEISSVVKETAKNTIDAVEAFSTTITSHATSTGSEFPFVTVQDFTSRAERLRKLTRAITVNYAPIVEMEELPAWMNYTAENIPGYYQEYLDFIDLDIPVEAVVNMTIPFVANAEWTTFTITPVEGPGPFLVGWQFSGLLDLGIPLVNYNLIIDPKLNTTFQSALVTNMPSLDFILRPTVDLETGEATSMVMESQIMEPVFETIYNGKRGRNELKMAGVVLVTFNWETYFRNILSEDVQGIIIVLSSSCTEDVFTYQVNGGVAVGVGPGDLHDTRYDDLVITTPFASFEFDPETLANTQTCVSELTMRIYPSKSFEESFYTRNSTVFALGVIGIFAFTSLIFCIYDLSVRRRQDIVMARIIRQDKIVSNMFPAAIRDRMYENGDKKDKKGKDTPEGLELDDDMDSPDIFGGAPLAELYPDVTVIFCDIAGFTAWSSAREPSHSEYFSLLLGGGGGQLVCAFHGKPSPLKFDGGTHLIDFIFLFPLPQGIFLAGKYL